MRQSKTDSFNFTAMHDLVVWAAPTQTRSFKRDTTILLLYQDGDTLKNWYIEKVYISH
jgi:hypothetical protein